MTNVLPTQEKKRLWSFYRGRFILVGTTSLCLVAVIGLAVLAPTYFMLSRNRSIIEEALAKEYQGAQGERAEAFKAQALLSEMKPYVTTSLSPMGAIEASLKIKPEGVAISHISFSNEARARIVLRGFASSRDLLSSFRKELEGTGLYSSVTVPVGDLVAGKGQFTLTLVAK